MKKLFVVAFISFSLTGCLSGTSGGPAQDRQDRINRIDYNDLQDQLDCERDNPDAICD